MKRKAASSYYPISNPIKHNPHSTLQCSHGQKQRIQRWRNILRGNTEPLSPNSLESPHLSLQSPHPCPNTPTSQHTHLFLSPLFISPSPGLLGQLSLIFPCSLSLSLSLSPFLGLKAISCNSDRFTSTTTRIVIMSCNGCRVLRRGCSDSCMLRPCLQWIETPEAQGHATVFVAKFFGRAGLMSFISAVPDSQRPVLFQSLLFEACGRTINPVNGAVGLLWTGNWHVCQAAVETVLRGGTLRPIPELLGGASTPDEASEADVGGVTISTDMWRLRDPSHNSGSSSRFTSSRSARISSPKRKRSATADESSTKLLQLQQHADLDLQLTPTPSFKPKPKPETRRPGTPSMNSDESGVTTCFESGFEDQHPYSYAVGTERKLLNLFP